MAGVAEKARNAHRVLKLRELGFEETSLDGIDPPDPVEEGAEQQIGGGDQHPAVATLKALKKSADDGAAADIDDLLGMSNEALEEEWRRCTGISNEEIDPEGMEAAWESQERDLKHAEEKPRTAEDLIAAREGEDE